MDLSNSSAKPAVLHIICDRDVGLFNLILSVIPHVDWAISERRIPVVYYGAGNCYWTLHGYRDRDTVWEYYFEPIVPEFPVSSIPPHIRKRISVRPPVRSELGSFVDEFAFVSNHPTGLIRFEDAIKDYVDPSDRLRQKASAIIRDYIRPRHFIAEKFDRFLHECLAGQYVIGVHIRATDALVDPNRALKENQIDFQKYFAIIERLLRVQPKAGIFVASDAQSSVDIMRKQFGTRVIAYDSIRHKSGDLAGKGPTGRIMPAYLTWDADRAARSGEEAVIEYLLLCRCDYLVHNGSSMARAVLLTVPTMPASNTIPKLSYFRHTGRVWRRRAALVQDTLSGKPIWTWYPLLRKLWITKRAVRRGVSAGGQHASTELYPR